MAEHAVPVGARAYDQAMSAPRTRRVKITVRLSPERMRRARKAVKKGYAPSISAWVEEAVRRMDSSYGWCETTGEWEEAVAEYVRECDPPLTGRGLASAPSVGIGRVDSIRLSPGP